MGRLPIYLRKYVSSTLERAIIPSMTSISHPLPGRSRSMWLKLSGRWRVLGALFAFFLTSRVLGGSTDYPFTISSTAYDISFFIIWDCDDYPVNSTPGRLQLLDGSGTLVAQVTGAIYQSSGVSINPTNGSVDNVTSVANRFGSGGSVAEGNLSGILHVTGLTPGNYTVRVWDYTTSTAQAASTVWTYTTCTGGSSPTTGVSFNPSPVSFTFNGGWQGPNANPNPGDATYSTSGTASAVNAGSYSVQFDGTGSFVGSSGTINWSIAPLGVSFWLSQTSFTYNGGSQGPAVYCSDGGASYSLGGTLSAVDAGTYYASASAYGNYAGSNGSMGWTIDPANQSVGLSPGSQSISIGQSITFTASGGNNGYTWGGTAGASGSGSTKLVTFNSAGTYTVTVYSPGGGNWNTSNTASVTITVNKLNQAAVTINSAGSTTYGNSYTATATGGSGTGAIVWTLGAGSTAAGAAINSSTGAITANSSGTVVINAYRANDPMYNQSATTANFPITVGTRAITLTLAGSKAYNATVTPTGASASITSGTLAPGDSIGYSFSNTSSANVGTYTGLTVPAVSNAAAPTSRTSSYVFTHNGSYSIVKANQATVTITSGGSVIYGTAYTATASGGNGTGALVWTLGAGSTAAGAAINSSTGVITANSTGTVVFNAYRAGDSNYLQSATTANFTVTVAARPITITLTGSKAYNTTTAPTGAGASITTGSLAPGDSIGYSFANTSSPNVGSYPGLVTPTISSATTPTTRTPYYTISYTGAFNITQGTQSAVTITSAATTTYGNSYTATATGGSGTGVIVWALGTGSTATGAAINSSTGVITANSTGTVVIKAYRASDANYLQSATTSDFPVTVGARAITINLGGSKSYNGNTTPTGASATITSGTLSSGDTISYFYSNTASANAGSYSGLVIPTISNAATPTTRTPSYSISYTGSYLINKASQPTPTITSANNYLFRQSYTATATGGAGSGAFLWTLGAGSTAPAAAINSSTGVVSTTGTGTVVFNVYRAGDTNYLQSPTCANFTVTVNPSYDLTVTAGTGGTATGSATILAGSAVMPISSTSNFGYVFLNWSGSPVANSTAASTTISMNNANRAVQANFRMLSPGNLGTSIANTNVGVAYRDAMAGSPNISTASITLTNSGELNAIVDSISFTGQFSLNAAITFPYTIGPGASLVVTVRFTPTAGSVIGTNAGTLLVNVTNEAAGGSTTQSLSGNLSASCLAPYVLLTWPDL